MTEVGGQDGKPGLDLDSGVVPVGQGGDSETVAEVTEARRAVTVSDGDAHRVDELAEDRANTAEVNGAPVAVTNR